MADEDDKVIQEPEAIELPPPGDAAFAQLMDFLVSDEEDQGAGAGEGAAGAAAGGDGQPAAPVEGAGAGAAGSGTPTAGADGKPGVAPGEAGAAGATGAGDAAAAAAAAASDPDLPDAASFAGNWGAVIEGLEQRQTTELVEASTKEVAEEYAKYYDAIALPPRDLVNQEVPSPDGKGLITLKDTAEVRDWQDDIRAQLSNEVRDRASRKADEVKPMMTNLHNAVGIFQNNPDLVPRTKQFDKELADAFAKAAKPWAIMVDGKLSGYNIDAQPLINQIRVELLARRATAPAAAAPPAAPTAQQQRAAEQARTQQGTFAPPQAGILSTAGNSADDGDDLGVLWGTLGLPETFRV